MPATTIFLIVPLGHKAGSDSLLVADLFDACLEKHGIICRCKSTCIAQIHLIHTRPMLAIISLDFDAMATHCASNTTQERVIGTGLTNGIAVQTRFKGSQGWSILFVAQRDHGLVKNTKLQFRGSQRLVSKGLCSLNKLV